MIHDICANFIVKSLRDAGYEAYIVGGCLRDLILDKTPNNWEICTNADIANAFELFAMLDITVIKGLENTSISVILSEKELGLGEDTETKIYTINRYKIAFNKSTDNITLQEDLMSRDFTINSLAYNDKEGIIDYCGGLEDIKNRKIRCIGDTFDNLKEDPVRILRAIRFKYQLDFEIDENTEDVINSLVVNNILDKANDCAKQQEFIKILIQDNIDKLLLTYKNVIVSIIPELMDCDEFTFLQGGKVENTYRHMAKTAGVYNLKGTVDYRDRLAAFLHDLAKPATYRNDFQGHEHIGALLVGNIMHRLNFSSYDTEYVTTLIKHHGDELTTEYDIKKLISDIGVDSTYKLFELIHADILANNPKDIDVKMKNLLQCRKWLDGLSGKAIGFSIKDLKINGKDLIDMGMEPGKNFGNILSKMADLVLLGDLQNDKEVLTRYVQVNYAK